MPVLDTEVLFALRSKDKHHSSANRTLRELTSEGSKLYATDSAILEFQLVLRSSGKPSDEVRHALLALKVKLESYGITEVLTLGLDVLALQAELEEKHELSYFDSMIAASATALDSAVVSDDDAFERVPGLKRIPLAQ